MPSIEPAPTGRTYWRSLDDYANTPAFRRFVEDEFPGLAAALSAGPTRRQFLKVMGASLALAGMTGCRWPRETIVPYANRPNNRAPGVPVQYATAFELAGVARPLLITSFDGRPIKIEGNDSHPFSGGATDAICQASVLELYDPDRSALPIRRDGRSRTHSTREAFEEFARDHFGALRANGGRGLCVLGQESSSPTLAELRTRWQQAFPQARWFEFEPLSRDHEREGLRLLFGRPCRAQLRLDRADVILSLDADFLMTHPGAVRYTRDFARGRTGEGGRMNRLYVLESRLTVTGAAADHRYAVRAGEVATVAKELARRVLAATNDADAAAFAGEAASTGVSGEMLDGIARDLVAHAGRCVVVAGPQQPPAVHALAHKLNHALGNVGQAITYTLEPEPERLPHFASLANLAGELEVGTVETLMILGGNPAYDAPADLRFGESLGRVPTTIHLSLWNDETSRLCAWHVPAAHYLESWGDARAWDGTISLIQPLIAPLYDGITALELLALATGDDVKVGYDLVRRSFKTYATGTGDIEDAWQRCLADGLVADTAWPAFVPDKLRTDWYPQLSSAAATRESFEVVVAPDYRLYDGRFANNGWLQELPDPITKLTWDNAALLHPADARELSVDDGDMLELGIDGRKLTIAALLVPGQARGSITLPLGGGRSEAAGRVAHGAGFDVARLRSTDAPYIVHGATIRHTGRKYPLSTTQDHHAIRSATGAAEQARRVPELIREATLAHYNEHPDFAKHVTHLPVLQSLWPPHEYSGHKWGMAIDLARCTGCSACVVACQAENNIPVVGKDEVARGREMHWIRVDRYFKGAPEADDVQVVQQPLTCHHCENAPCEQVCPVAATVHDEEGLNVMVYNRCVGTRYCNNNCPYKVRRFNWFYNHHGPKHPRRAAHLTDIEKMVFNPEVTVRSRGVMEKCTFCVQRINAAKIQTRNEGQPLTDGLIVPACAQACPAEAIVFGDLNDPASRVRKAFDHPRSYQILAELNVKPRTSYLARLRNPRETQTGHESGSSDSDAPGGHAG